MTEDEAIDTLSAATSTRVERLSAGMALYHHGIDREHARAGLAFFSIDDRRIADAIISIGDPDEAARKIIRTIQEWVRL